MKIKAILDRFGYDALYEEAVSMTDRLEGEARKKLLDAVGKAAADYIDHVIEYEYRKYCKAIAERGLRFKPVDKAAVVAKWDEYFASELSEETREKIYFYTDFRWHMFSYGSEPVREGAEARRAFNRCRKGAAYLFIECTDEAWFIENADLLKAKDLDADFYFEREDIHIFDAEGKWTYAKTHESDLGPYFQRRK